jgi:hypothetical protein
MLNFQPILRQVKWSPAKLGESGWAEIKGRLPELEEPLKFMGVSLAWIGADLVGHQLIPTIEAERTPPSYYKNKLLLAPVFLLAGRIISDVIGGSDAVRALTLGTTANALMQVGYLMSYPADFNAAVFLLHEAIVVPLSYFLIGKPGRILFFKEGPG